MKTIKPTAIYFIILLGIVSLLADVVYEGSRSISGQYLSLLGASAAVVATVAGFGELIGYTLRLLSGYISDKTRQYWAITILGYAVNLAAVPALALTSHWQAAALLMVIERFGKAIRTPARDAMLSYATHEVGRGKGFGIHQALDQIGAIIGPLLMMAMLFYQAGYPLCFGVLAIPAIAALCVLFIAKKKYPVPETLEIKTPSLKPQGLTKPFWLYLAAVSLIGAGYADFPFIAYHFQKHGIVSDIWIPIFYAFAMGVDGLSALLLGPIYDRRGISVLIVVSIVSALFAPLVFLGGFYFSLLGIVLWGIGLGAQGSIMRAVVANLISPDKRGTAYGILNTGFGVFWFLGSVLMGLLYDYSLPLLIFFSVSVQLVSVPLFFAVARSLKVSERH